MLYPLSYVPLRLAALNTRYHNPQYSVNLVR